MPEPTLDPGMLEWLAAVNGVSPEEYLQGQHQAEIDEENARRAGLDRRVAMGDLDALDERTRTRAADDAANWQNFGMDQVQQGRDMYEGLQPWQDALTANANDNQTRRDTALNNQTNAFNSATASNAGIIGNLQQGAQRAAQQENGLISSFGGVLQGANNMDAANVGRLTSVANSMGQLSPSAYQGDAVSNPADIARQQASYDALGGWASGANDIYSDPGLVSQQQGVVDQFGNWASGANDVSSDAGLVGQQQDVYGGFLDYANGNNAISSDAGLVGMQQGVYDDFGQFASGAMDLESEAATATADAEALAAQKEALGEFRERMDPKLTDAERFMHMQSRLAQEQSQRAARDANYRELERRGMGGSTMALSNLNASSAEASNTRALQDLGANAKAIDRAEKALVNYGNMSSTIADQSFERDFATKSAADRMAVQNNQQRLQGIAGQGQMATEMRRADDEMRQFNSQQQMQGLQGAGMMANTMRGQDDAMRNANADRRLAGTQGQGDMLNSMRASDDAMRMGNRDARLQGTIQQGQMATDMRNANDALAMFNKEQQGIQLRHADDFRATQQRDAWNREADLSDAGFRQTENIDRRADMYTGRAQTAIENQFDRDDRIAGRGIDVNRDFVEGYDRLTGRTNEAARDRTNDFGTAGEFALGRTGVAQRAQESVDETRREILRGQSEDRRTADAIDQAYKDNELQRRYDEEHPSGWQ